MSNVDDYYKELAARPKPNTDKLANLQTDQAPIESDPADGGEGFVGSNTGNAPGFDVVEGKKGYSKDMPVWSQQSSGDDQGLSASPISNGGSDSADEGASYKNVQTDEGLPQTYRDSSGAGDAGPTGSDEPDGRGVGEVNPDTQSVPGSGAGDHEMSDMPQTDFTHNEGGGAPRFKHGN